MATSSLTRKICPKSDSGKSIREDASRKTWTFDIVVSILSRRLQWVGHILRMDQRRLVYQAVRYMHKHRKEGDLLMDTPDRFTWAELTTIAADRDGWRHRVRALKQPSRVEITINADVSGARLRNKETQPTPSPIKPKTEVKDH